MLCLSLEEKERHGHKDKMLKRTDQAILVSAPKIRLLQVE